MFDTVIIPASILGGLALLFGLVLAVASKKFAVKNSDERIDKIIKILSGANCAACGYTGCAAYAQAVVNDGESCSLCAICGDKVTKEISKIMGVAQEQRKKSVARVLCSGNADVTKQKYEYAGVNTCAAAAQMHAGQAACRFGCLGFGDCVHICPLHAISIDNGLATVIESRCEGCGLCATVCPKKIIKVMPKSNRYSVMCSNTDKGVSVRKICQQGCIGCTKCIKACEVGAISMVGGLAVIDPIKCNNCGACVAQCPTHAIQQVKNVRPCTHG